MTWTAVAGRAAGDFVNQLVVVRHRPIVERDDRVVGPEAGAVAGRIAADVLNQGAAATGSLSEALDVGIDVAQRHADVAAAHASARAQLRRG